jgi:acylpyruvate hydrolase
MAFPQSTRKIVAIGRNYASHIKELSNATPKEPFFFLKPTSSFLPSSTSSKRTPILELPRGIIPHYEVELGFVISKLAKNVKASENVMDYIKGYTLAVDMTARNLQDRERKKGLPWSAAKGFDGFTPIGTFIDKSKIQDPYGLRLKLSVRVQLRF